MDPNLILFGIEAGVKLGQKFYEVLVDANVERPLFLPLGDLFGSIPETKAVEFFDRPENQKLVQTGGPYFEAYEKSEAGDRKELLEAYRSLLVVNQQLGNPASVAGEAVDLIRELHAFEQFKKGDGHAPPVQRLIGVLVEVGIDFFQANPQALGENSAARKVVSAFITRIKPLDFDQAPENHLQIFGKVLLAGLYAFGENTNLVSRDGRIQVLLGGMAGAIIDDFKDAESESQGTADRRQKFFERVTSSLLRGAMAGFAGNPTLFLKGDDHAEKIIRDTVTQIFKGLSTEAQEKLFTNESLEVIFKSALVAVTEDVDTFTDQLILQKVISGTVNILRSKAGKEIFSEGTVAAILQNGLNALGENIKTLIDPNNPQRLFLVEGIAALTAGLGTTLGSGKLKDLLSTQQLIQLSHIVFSEVAQHPERLLGSTPGDAKMTALAQIVGSVSQALGDDPHKLITGTGLLTLLQTAIRTTGQNIDILLDLNSQNPGTNLLCKILEALTKGFSDAEGIKALFTREMFADAACRVIVTASNNLGFVPGGKDALPGLITKLMTLTVGQEVWKRLNSGNFPVVFEGLLRQVLLCKLKLENAGEVQAAVEKILESL